MTSSVSATSKAKNNPSNLPKMTTAGRAQYDVLRIMRKLTTDEQEEPTKTATMSLRERQARNHHLDVLTSEDMLQAKYAELGGLLAAQVVERKALSCLGTVLTNKKGKRHGKSSSPRTNASTEGNRRRKSHRRDRPTSATSSQYTMDSSRYDSDGTEFTEESGTTCSSAKRVSFADDIVSFSGGESSVVITEITEDETELEERIKRRPRVSLAEEEMEAAEMMEGSPRGPDENNMASSESAFLRGILRGGTRPRRRRANLSPSRSTTPRQQRQPRSPKRSVSYGQTKEQNNVSNSKAKKRHGPKNSDNIYNEQQSRRSSPRRKGHGRSTTPRSANTSAGRKANRPASSRSPRKKRSNSDGDEAYVEPVESPRREIVSPDHKLSNTNNVHIKAWLRKKEAALRQQKREERKKEKVKTEAEESKRQERLERLADAESKYDDWMNEKKKVTRLSKRVARKVFNDTGQNDSGGVGEKETLDATLKTVEAENRPVTPAGGDSGSGKAKPRKVLRSRYSFKKTTPKVEPLTTHDNRIGIVRDYDGDWTDSVSNRRDLGAERARDEEKRQAKEAKKREQQLNRARKAEQQKIKSESKRKFPRGTSSANKAKQTNQADDRLDAGLTRRRPPVGKLPTQPQRPSSNPLKGLTYDQWVNQKLKLEKDRKDEIKAGLADPDLEDLIPLLAKHRIDRAKEPSKRVDSGLRRPQSSTTNHKSTCSAGDTYTEQSKTQKDRGGAWQSFPKSSAFLNVKTPTPPNTPLPNRTHSRNGGNNMDVDDVISSVRPEPQGCEIPEPLGNCPSSSMDQTSNVFITETVS